MRWTFDEAAADRRALAPRPGHRPLPVHDRRLDRRAATTAGIPTTCPPIPNAAATRRWPMPSGGSRTWATSPACTTTTRTCIATPELGPGRDREEARRVADHAAGGGWAAGPTWSAPRSRSSWPCARRTCRRSSGCSPRGATSSTRPTRSVRASAPTRSTRSAATTTSPGRCRLSDEARKLFGIFGSECGREWALPHSDFFEGLVGVSGRYFHNLDPAKLGATVIPFWEMVYHDCQIAWGKYGYSADEAAPFVAHHVLCARPLYYHSVPDHLYWTGAAGHRSSRSRRATAAVTRAPIRAGPPACIRWMRS